MHIYARQGYISMFWKYEGNNHQLFMKTTHSAYYEMGCYINSENYQLSARSLPP